jgi:hypothetical protein
MRDFTQQIKTFCFHFMKTNRAKSLQDYRRNHAAYCTHAHAHTHQKPGISRNQHFNYTLTVVVDEENEQEEFSKRT